MESSSINMTLHATELIKPSSLESKSKVSSSLAEPRAIYRNCTSSLSDFLAAPSAIFTGIDVQALLICEVRPNFSSGGKSEVNAYSFLTRSKLCFQASRFWWGFISRLSDVIEDKAFNRNNYNLLSIFYSPLTIFHNLFSISY